MSNKVKRDANEDGLVYKTLESIIKKAAVPVDPVEQAVNPLQQLKDKSCPSCQCAVGEAHSPGCDRERCASCGGQRISCGCSTETAGIPWAGEAHGKADCRRLGFYSKPKSSNPRDGWVTCDKNDPEAREDLNRLFSHCKWNKKTQRFELI